LEGEQAYAAPPVSLVLRRIRKIAITQMSGVLIISLWKNAKFWTFKFQVSELERLEAKIASEDSAAAGSSGSKPSEVIKTAEVVETHFAAEEAGIEKAEAPAVVRATSTPIRQGADSAPVDVSHVSAPEVPMEFEDFGTASEDEEAASLDQSNADLMLQRSVKALKLAKYSRLWDKWATFASFHEVEVLPPDMRALEIFVLDTGELFGSAGIVNLLAAAVARFYALEGYLSPFKLPRFSKILRGVKISFGRAAKPKRPFLREHITTFMDWARAGSLWDWRAALPLAMCYQELLGGAECFELHGANVARHPGFFLVDVNSDKNY
jgi:hypothetical protein